MHQKMPGWRAHQVVVFKTKVLHFKIEDTPIKDTSGKRKFNGMRSSFLGTNESFSLFKLSFNEFNLVSTRRIVTLCLFIPTMAVRILKKLEACIFCTLWSRNCTFLIGNFWIYKGFMYVFYILTSAWKKNHKMFIWNWFFATLLSLFNSR